jgi:hypothetical protein
MIRACNPTVVGKPGVFALYIAEGPKASDYKQGQLISVRSGLNARAGADGASAEPFGFSTRVPTGTRAIRHPHDNEANLAQHHWSSTGSDHVSGHRANLTCSQHFSRWLRDPSYKRPSKRPLQTAIKASDP